MTGNNNEFGREQAWQLLTEWTESESLLKHALAVEACVTACGDAEAARLGLIGEDRAAMLELYATTALLHDFDYQRHPTPEEHPFVGVRELDRLGWPPALRTAILGHAQYSGVPRESHLAKVLFACDELAGFLTACALVKPTKAIADVEVRSVRKKMKDKAFARGVNRDDVIQGAAELGVDLDDHIAFCIEAMKKRLPAGALTHQLPQLLTLPVNATPPNTCHSLLLPFLPDAPLHPQSSSPAVYPQP
jgi:predicted hydrolase (HD superfamily)